MILDEIKQLKTGPRELRKFGLLVGSILAVLGILYWARHKPIYPWFLAPGGALVLLGVVWPRMLKPVYIAWMSLAIVLGFIVSHVLLTLFFFIVITPIGLVARLAGKDFLRLKLDPNATSYWIPRARQEPGRKPDYEQQY